MNPIPHFSVTTLIYDGDLIVTAAQAHPEIATRLTAGTITNAVALQAKVAGDVSGQKGKKGAAGTLTLAQRKALLPLERWLAKARKTAKLAFPGQAVKLHQEFQVGIHSPYDLASFLGRTDIVIASLQSTDNVPALQSQGWTDADTQAFAAARKIFGKGDETKQTAKGGGKDATALKNTDAADFYAALLAIQNAAELQWPADDPANAGIRDEFLLNTFPPAGGSGDPAPAPATAPATPKP